MGTPYGKNNNFIDIDIIPITKSVKIIFLSNNWILSPN